MDTEQYDETLNFILDKYKGSLRGNGRPQFEIENMGRNNLAELFGELGFKSGAEVGVEYGLFSEILCKANPSMHLYSVDAWKSYAGYRDHVLQDKLDGFYEASKVRLAPYNSTIIRGLSVETAATFEDNSLDFVYIDANHEFPYVVQDLIAWSKKIRPGGIISGHDYYQSRVYMTRCHVVYAVDGFTRAYRIHPWFLVGTKAKTSGMIRDDSRSWMWVKRSNDSYA